MSVLNKKLNKMDVQKIIKHKFKTSVLFFLFFFLRRLVRSPKPRFIREIREDIDQLLIAVIFFYYQKTIKKN